MIPLKSRYALVVFVSCILALYRINGEWLDIKPILPSDDAFHMHINDPLLGPFALETENVNPPVIIHNRVGLAMAVLPKPLKDETITTQVPPIRYEDLEHLVGQGFEESLEKYYQQHKHSLDESTRRSDVNNGDHIGHNDSVSKPPKTYYLPGTDDPWSIYDKPPEKHSPIGIKHSATTERQVTPPITTEFSSEINDFNNATLDDIPKPLLGKKKRVVKLVPVRLVPMPTESMKASSIGFPGFVAFLRNIQDSILMSTSNSIQDKMQLLTSFRDKMLRQISKTTASNMAFKGNV